MATPQEAPTIGPGPHYTGPPGEPRASVDPATKWDCPFPSARERGTKHEADVKLSVTVEADGTPSSAEILEDPGNGYGPAAQKCALAARGVYIVARDEKGNPIRAKSFPFTIHFVLK